MKAAINIIFLTCWCCRSSSDESPIDESSSLLYIQGKRWSSEWWERNEWIPCMYMASYTCTCIRRVWCANQSDHVQIGRCDIWCHFFMPPLKTHEIKKIFCSQIGSYCSVENSNWNSQPGHWLSPQPRVTGAHRQLLAIKRHIFIMYRGSSYYQNTQYNYVSSLGAGAAGDACLSIRSAFGLVTSLSESV